MMCYLDRVSRIRLYFADTAYGAIQAVDYNGGNRVVVIKERKLFFDMTIFKVSYYFHIYS